MNPPETFMHLSALEWTAAQTIVATLALCGLAWYCFETYLLRKVAQEQKEGAYRPVLAIFEDFPKLEFKNVGTGPALNVRYVFATNISKESERATTAIAVGEGASFGDLAFFLLRKAVEISYESVSGRAYVTRGEWKADAAGVAHALTLKITEAKGSKSQKFRVLSR